MSDLAVALFELLDVEEPCGASSTRTVFADEERGHIAVVVECLDGEHPTAATFTDTGDTLHLWAFSAAHLDTVQARALGEALIAWADRREAAR